MVITQNGRKKILGYHACLLDIMQNIAKMGVFCLFSKGSLEQVLQKLALSLDFKRKNVNLSD